MVYMLDPVISFHRVMSRQSKCCIVPYNYVAKSSNTRSDKGEEEPPVLQQQPGNGCFIFLDEPRSGIKQVNRLLFMSPAGWKSAPCCFIN